MSLPNPTSVVTEQRLKDFYDGILPYLGCSESVKVFYGTEAEWDALTLQEKIVYDYKCTPDISV